MPLFIFVSALFVGTQVPEIRPTQRFFAPQWQAPQELGGRLIPYRLYVPSALGTRTASSNSSTDLPETAQTDQLWPILVWFHGFGERGDDNERVLRWMELIFKSLNGDPPLFIMAVQDSLKAAPGEPDWLTITSHILDDVCLKYPVDPNRIYVAGVSSGGNACWEFACRYPHRFAAIAPMSTAGINPERASILTDVPVWTFYASNDTGTPKDAIASVELIRKNGGTARFTSTRPHSKFAHDSWTRAIREHYVLQWMLLQSRNSVWPWKLIAIWIAVVSVVGLACFSEWRRRKQTMGLGHKELTDTTDTECTVT